MSDVGAPTVPGDARFEDGEAKRPSLKKKKSLPRLFILARQKSSKRKTSSPKQAVESVVYAPHGQSVVAQSSEEVLVLPLRDAIQEPAKRESILTEAERNFARIRSGTFGAPTSRKGSYEYAPLSPWKSWEVDAPSTGGSSISPLSRNPTYPDSPSHAAHASNNGAGLPQRPKYIAYKRPSTASQATDPSRPKDSPVSARLTVGSARRADVSLSKLSSRAPLSDAWPPWQGLEEPRESVRSGVSTGSSLLDSTSTQRSSVFTKMSCISDTTLDMEDTDGEETKGGLTVDDAIDLYSAGFDGDFDIPEGHPMREEARRVSQEAAAAAKDSMDNGIVPSRRRLEPSDATSPAPVMRGDVFQTLFPEPPPIQPPTATHDQYGFRKASRDVSLEDYDAWWAEYAPFQRRRTAKWISLLHDHGLPARRPTQFPPRSAKIQRFIRKGVPPAWRGAVWFHYAGGPEFLWAHPGRYAELVLQSGTAALAATDREAIERDLHRTFPDNVWFKPDGAPPSSGPFPPGAGEPPSDAAAETPRLSALRRVLCAFALDHPRIGYCQSLNFIAGLLLLFLPEEKAFWMLHIVTTQYLPGTHDLSLEGANVDVWVLMLALKDAAPAVWAAIGGDEAPAPGASVEKSGASAAQLKPPPVSLCTTAWFMSLFIGTLPPEAVLRVWDVLFYEGAKTLFRVALAVFRLGAPQLRRVQDPVEAFPVVQALPRRILDARALLATATARGALGRGWIERRRAERKAMYRGERAGERRRKESRDAGRLAESVPPPASVPPPPAAPGSAVAGPRLSDVVEEAAFAPAHDSEPEPKTKAAGWWPRLGTKKGRSQ